MSINRKAAALAVAALALDVPAASAHPPSFDCSYAALRSEPTGTTFEGAALGYVVHLGDAGATIYCYVTVNGVAVAGTPTGTGVTAGHVSYSAADGDTVQLCAEATTAHVTSTSCTTVDEQAIPPAIVPDIVRGVLVDFVDPTVCTFLANISGTYGPVVINAQGDVYVDGEPQWDCPPYDIWDPSAGGSDVATLHMAL